MNSLRGVLHKSLKPVLGSLWVAIIILCYQSSILAGHFRIEGDQSASIQKAHISIDAPTDAHVEPFLAINPKNPANMLVTSIVNEQGKLGAAVYRSEDEGQTWSRVHLQKEAEEVAAGGDPVVYFDILGAAYFATIGNGLRLTRSADGGRTWTKMTTAFPGSTDREYLAFTGNTGKLAGRIYAIGTAYVIRDLEGALRRAILICYSTDGGTTFSAPKMLVATSQGENIGTLGDMIVTPDHKIIIPFETKSDVDDADRKLKVIISKDGGASFSKPKEVANIRHAKGYRYLKGMGVIRAAIDPSTGVTGGRVYLVWSDFNGEQYDVKCAHSDDGEQWSRPLKVNDNVSASDQANPAIAVNKNGVMAVIWNDRRDSPVNDCFRLYGAYSIDGGDSFLANFNSGDGMTCPNAPGNWTAQAISVQGARIREGELHRLIAISTVASRWPNGGETQGLVATPKGDFAAAVINGTSGVMQLWLERLMVDRAYKAVPKDTAVDSNTELRLNAHHARFDIERRRILVDVDIENGSEQPLNGRLALILRSLQSGMKDVRVANADNGKTGVGAEWHFSAAGQASSLEAHAHTNTRTIELEFSQLVTDSSIDPASMEFIIVRDP